MRALGVLAALGLAIVTVIAGVWWYALETYRGPGPSTRDGSPRIVVIERGASVGAIAETLAEAGAISDPRQFRLAVAALNADARLKAGEYTVPSASSIRTIIALLIEGRSLQYPFTLPEGLTTRAALQRLKEEPLLTGELPETDLAEGVLLPDTYLFERGAARASLLQRMIKAREEIVADLWARRQAGLPLQTLEEAVILASIVEKETGLAVERPQVAAVFVNRLRRGMRLESDPTIIYGVCRLQPERCDGDKLIDEDGRPRGLRRSEIDNAQNRFNTYQIDGLPPTPIANPGREALAAVLDPPVTEALFFVADGSGGHAFASTYAEHLRNVEAWRRIESGAAPEPAPGGG